MRQDLRIRVRSTDSADILQERRLASPQKTRLVKKCRRLPSSNPTGFYSSFFGFGHVPEKRQERMMLAGFEE